MPGVILTQADRTWKGHALIAVTDESSFSKHFTVSTVLQIPLFVYKHVSII